MDRERRGRVGRMARASERAKQAITKVDLRRLSEIAAADRDDLFRRKPHLRHYRNRIVCVALCQGAALHYLDGHNGVKDFDVWTFYAHARLPFPYRRVGKKDFGISKFGRRPKDAKRFIDRRVDLIGRSLKVRPSADALEAIEDYLTKPRTKSAKKLAKKAVVLIDPPQLRGRVAWDPRRR